MFTVEAEATGPTSVVIEWGDGPQATRFEVEGSIVGESVSVEADVPASTRTFAVNGLQSGTTYVFRVTAFLAQGDTVEATDVVTTEF